MATVPFGAILEGMLKSPVQGAKFHVESGFVVNPLFACCISGTTVGVDKDPIPVISLSAQHVCTGAAVTVDYSNSWSPSSTINTWEVDWGDGQISNGAWPGAGSVAHPLGGYVLPGTYTITLTVTDLLGATGIATIQIEVIDCTLFPLPLFVGCDSSGVWFSPDGGVSAWEERGGGVIDGQAVYDLKCSPFTQAIYYEDGSISTDSVELWAATEIGLYKSINGGMSWSLIVLPPPSGIGDQLTAYSIAISKISIGTVYVLAKRSDEINAWIGKTEDGGATWSYYSVGGGASYPYTLEDATGASDYIHGHKLVAIHIGGGPLTTCWAVGPGGSGARYRDALGVWHSYGTDLADNIDIMPDYPYSFPFYMISCGDGGAAWWDRTAGGAPAPSLFMTCPPGSVNLLSFPLIGGFYWQLAGCLTGAFISQTTIYNVLNLGVAPACCWDIVDIVSLPSGSGTIRFIGPLHDTYSGTWFTTSCKIYGANGFVFYEEWSGSPGPIDSIFWSQKDLNYFVARGTKRLLVRNIITGGWDEDDTLCPHTINCAHAWANLGTHSRAIGTDYGIYIYQNDPLKAHYEEYVMVSTLPGVKRIQCVFIGIHSYIIAMNSDGIYLIDVDGAPTPFEIPSTGRTSLLDVDSKEEYVYACGLVDNFPVVVRVGTDMVEETIIENPGAGTWAGVVCDNNLTSRVWVFGDLGTEKVLGSDDDGTTLVDVTDGTWGGSELVRPLMLSIYDPASVVAILNDANETWRSENAGGTWNQIGGAIPFDCQSGARDWFSHDAAFVGTVVKNADNVELTVYTGYSWTDRSIPVSARISSVIIL